MATKSKHELGYSMSTVHVDFRMCVSSMLLASVCYFSSNRFESLCVRSTDSATPVCFPPSSSLTYLWYSATFGAVRYGVLPRFWKFHKHLSSIFTFWSIPLLAFHFLVVTKQASREWVSTDDGSMPNLAFYTLVLAIGLYFFNIWSGPEIVGAISFVFVLLSLLQALSSIWFSMSVLIDYSIGFFGVLCCVRGLGYFLRNPEGRSTYEPPNTLFGLRAMHWYYLLMTIGVICVQYSLQDIFLAQNTFNAYGLTSNTNAAAAAAAGVPSSDVHATVTTTMEAAAAAAAAGEAVAGPPSVQKSLHANTNSGSSGTEFYEQQPVGVGVPS